MASNLLAVLDGLAAPGVLALYAGRADEADPRALLELMPPTIVAWPRVVGDDLELAICEDFELVPGFRGILEPPPEFAPIGLSRVRMIVVPGLGFDRRGRRIGYGRGYYDRLLERLRGAAHPGLIVGLAYASQIVDEIPCEPHDQTVDLVITEDGLVSEA